MIYRYIYGRLDEGYACINRDELPFSNEDYDRLKSFITYEPPEMSAGSKLPEEFYFYNDVLSTGPVGIVGKTMLVKGGTGVSGARDTSLIQRYIFTDDDYRKLLSDSDLIFGPKDYFNTLEDYFSENISHDDGTDLCTGGLSASELGLTEEVFVNLLYCCISAFADRERRVYIYLPENSSEGTLFARRLMKLVFDSIPGFLYSNAGFVTYSPGFESSTLNPVPNEVSVIFVADSKENYLKRSRVDSRNYVFDFQNGEYPSINIDDKTYNTLKGVWQRAEVRDILNECLLHVFKTGTGVLSEVFTSLLVLARAMSRENRSKLINDKRDAVLDLLNYGMDELLPDGLTMLENNVLAIFETDEIDYEFLKFAGEIYVKADCYRNYITSRLCDEALKLWQQGDVDGIFDVTDFEYADENLNDEILNLIYSKGVYRPLAEILFVETVSPVIEKTSLKFSERLQKLLDFVSSSISPKYSKFANEYCVGFIFSQVGQYLDEFDGNVRKKLEMEAKLTYPGFNPEAGQQLPDKFRFQAAGLHFDVVCGLEEMLGRYLTFFDDGFVFGTGEICRKAVDGIKDNYKIITSQKTKELLADWEKKYGGISQLTAE